MSGVLYLRVFLVCKPHRPRTTPPHACYAVLHRSISREKALKAIANIREVNWNNPKDPIEKPERYLNRIITNQVYGKETYPTRSSGRAGSPPSPASPSGAALPSAGLAPTTPMTPFNTPWSHRLPPTVSPPMGIEDTDPVSQAGNPLSQNASVSCTSQEGRAQSLTTVKQNAMTAAMRVQDKLRSLNVCSDTAMAELATALRDSIPNVRQGGCVAVQTPGMFDTPRSCVVPVSFVVGSELAIFLNTSEADDRATCTVAEVLKVLLGVDSMLIRIGRKFSVSEI